MTNPFKLPDALTGPEEDLIAKAKAGEWCFLFTDDNAAREYRAAPDDKKEDVGGKRVTRPDADGAQPDRNVIRAIVIMHLALGGDENEPVHPQGVQLSGAWITGKLDFHSSTLTRPLALLCCYIATAPVFRDARSKSICFDGSLVPALDMSGLRSEGPVFLRYGFEAAETVLLRSAQIGGQLACDGGSFKGEKLALGADNLVTEGPVFLRDGFKAAGTVELVTARIHGELDCSGGVFLARSAALRADRSDIRGHLFLNAERDDDGEPVTEEECRGFQAVGLVRFPGATIKGDLRCDGGQFEGKGGEALRLDEVTVRGSVRMSASFKQDETLAAESRVFKARGGVRLDGARIQSQLRLQGGKFEAVENDEGVLSRFRLEGARIEAVLHLGAGTEHSPAARLNTPVDLRAATVGTLRDCSEAYADLDRFTIRLDGFTYRRITGPTDASERIAWLDQQPKEDKGADFKPQPYEQLAKSLRDMGHTEDAKRVAIRKQRGQREAAWLQRCAQLSNTKRPRVSWLERRGLMFNAHFRWWMSRLFGLIVGYGYRPLYALGWLAVFVFLGWWIFAGAYDSGVMVPNDPRTLRSEGWLECAARAANSAECWLTEESGEAVDSVGKLVRGRDYPPFDPLWYALDTFVPFVDLHQESRWIPDPESGSSAGWWARLYLYLHISVGWIITALAAASLTGVVKKDV